MKKKPLRDYQIQMVEDLGFQYRGGMRSLVAVLPTGGGKTVVASEIASNVTAKGKTVWFLCHRDFLIDQTVKTFRDAGMTVGVIAAGHPGNVVAMIQVVSVDTIRARLKKQDKTGVVTMLAPDWALWDECHHIQAASWKSIMDWMGPSCRHLGFTATPERLDGKGLRPLFQEMVIGPSTGELIKMDFLSKWVGWTPSTVDTSGVHKLAGDFKQGEMDEAVRKAFIMGDVVEHWKSRAFGLRTVAFCPSIEYSKEIALEFQSRGIRAIHLDGDTKSEERRRIARAFADGEYDILTNCALIGEGYDLAAQAGIDVTIEAVICLRPTESLSLWRQMVGRALRPKSHPAVILDHVGNLARHGGPDEEIAWDLDGRKKSAKAPTLAHCPSCMAVSPPGSRFCLECGEDLQKHREEQERERIRIEHIEGELVAYDASKRKLSKRDYVRRIRACETRQDFEALGKELGYKPGWAFYQMKAREERGAVQ